MPYRHTVTVSLQHYIRERHSQLQPPTSPNTPSRTGALLQRRPEKQTGTVHSTQTGALFYAPIMMPTTKGQWKRLSALLCQPACKWGKTSANVMHQVLGGNWSLKRNFVLLDWEKRSLPNWLPLSPRQLPITILRKNTSPKGVNNCAIPKDT